MVGVFLVEWPDVSNMLQWILDLNVPRAKLQQLKQGGGTRERRELNMWVWVFAGSWKIWILKGGKLQKLKWESLPKSTFWTKTSFSLLFMPLSQRAKMVCETKHFFSHPLYHHSPHTLPNPDCLGEDNLSLAENAKTVHFSQTLKNSN